MSWRIFDILYLAACSVLFFGLFHKVASPVPFGYDEADYMMGVRLGIAGNYLDTNALSLPEFVRAGLKAVRKEWSRTQLSEYVRGRRDPMFLRHYHGPINSYWLIVASALVGSDESRMRLSSLGFHWLTFLSVYAGILWVFGPRFRIAAVAASVCYLFCVSNITAISVLSSHGPFLWLSVVTLFVMSKLAAEPSRARYYWAVALCAVSFCALENAILLALVLAATMIAVRKEFFARWTRADYFRVARNTLLLVAGVCLAVWPSSILKLTIVQGLINIAFLSATRRGSFGDMGALEVWKMRFHAIPADMVTLVVCVAASGILFWRWQRRAQLLPFVLYGALLALTTLKNTSEGARYISSMFAPFYVSGALVLAERAKRIPMLAQAAGVAVLFGILLFVSHREVQARVARSASVEDETAGLIGLMRSRPTARVLVPFEFLPALEYYFPNTTIRSYPPGTNPAQTLAGGEGYDATCLYQTEHPVSDPGHGVWRAAAVTSAGQLTCYLRP